VRSSGVSPQREAISVGVAVTLIAVAAIAVVAPSLFRGEIFVLRDHFDYFAPMRMVTAARLASGDLPLWNRFSGSGEVWLANPQTAVFYPPAILFVVLPFSVAYQLFLALHLFVLGAGMFFWMRRHLSASAALFAGISLMLSGATLALLDVQNNLTSFAWMPVLFLAAEKVRESGSWRDHAIFSVIMTMTFLGAEPMLTLFGGSAALVTAFAHRGVRLARACGSLALAALSSSVQLMPFLDAFLSSDRKEGLAPAEAFRHSMIPGDWLAMFVSSATAGMPFELLDTSQQYLLSLYLGGATIVLAMLALGEWRTIWRRHRFVRVALLLAAAALLLSLGGNFGLDALFRLLHLDVGRYPSRFFPFVTLAVVSLAACALDRIGERSTRGKLVAGAAAAILVAISSWRLGGEEMRLVRTEVGLLSVLVATIALANWSLFGRRPLYFAFFVVILSVDLVSSARQSLLSGAPPAAISRFIDVIPAYAKIDRSSVPRPYDREAWLSGYQPLLHRFFDAESPSPLTSASYAALERDFRYFSEIAGADHMIVPAGERPSGYEVVDQGPGTDILRDPLMRQNLIRVASRWKEKGTDESARKAIEDASIPVITGVDGAETAHPADGATRVRVLAIEDEEQSYAISTRFPLLFWITQNDARGWRVEIDSKPAEKEKVFGTFRGVIVPAGSHRIRWHYDATSILFLALLSTAAIAASLSIIIFSARSS
jgi:hypothetical protein